MRKLKITVEGKSYEVTVELMEGGGASAPAPAPVDSPIPIASASVSAPTPPPPAPAPAAGAPGMVTSPLAGKVVTVQVKPGQQVKEGEQLIVLEAMKMNTYVIAPSDGTVAEILVQPGDATEEGQPLVRLT